MVPHGINRIECHTGHAEHVMINNIESVSIFVPADSQSKYSPKMGPLGLLFWPQSCIPGSGGAGGSYHDSDNMLT